MICVLVATIIIILLCILFSVFAIVFNLHQGRLAPGTLLLSRNKKIVKQSCANFFSYSEKPVPTI